MWRGGSVSRGATWDGLLGSRPTGPGWNAAVIVALAASVLPMLAPTSNSLMILHFLTFGLVFGAALPMRAAVMAHWFSGPVFGRIMGAQWTLAAFAGAGGPFLAGVSRDLTGSYRPVVVGVVVAFLASAALTLVAGRLAGRLRAG